MKSMFKQLTIPHWIISLLVCGIFYSYTRCNCVSEQIWKSSGTRTCITRFLTKAIAKSHINMFAISENNHINLTCECLTVAT